MSFVSFPCPVCGNTSYEQSLRFKGFHIFLVLITCGLWVIPLILNGLCKFFWNKPILPTHNRCAKCGNTFARQGSY